MTGRAAPKPTGPGGILDPPLPYRMPARIRAAVGDVQLQQFVGGATQLKDRGRVEACAAAFGDRYDDVRRLAGAIKRHAVDHLDAYLARFCDAAEAAGAVVHFAQDASQANAIVTGIATDAGCRRCVKSKSMVTEEIGLLPALEAAGVRTLETDLGEFILQLDGDAPSHIVTPMIHKDRTAVARAFVRELGAPYTESPEALTAIAREHLREHYRRADLGISGANFLLAESGSLVICTNEGNADLCVGTPPIHVAVVGIEKVIPSRRELPVFLKLLARSATAQALTVYTTLITGPRRSGDADGPRDLHVVLVDNGRSALLAGEERELLHCIRCGACLNACPVYRAVGGGHAYGAVYSGPIGAALTPLLKGPASYPDLAHASSLCGACHRACPVDIDIPRHLVGVRARTVRDGASSRASRLVYAAWAAVLRRPTLYRLSAAAARVLLRARGRRAPTPNDPYDDRRWLARLPGPLSGWTDARDFPSPTSASFRQWWSARRRAEGPR